MVQRTSKRERERDKVVVSRERERERVIDLSRYGNGAEGQVRRAQGDERASEQAY